jgi:hypothetical protein
MTVLSYDAKWQNILLYKYRYHLAALNTCKEDKIIKWIKGRKKESKG